jgi:MFS family permease
METIRSRFATVTADLPPTYWFLWLGILINRLGSFVIPFLTLYLTSQRGVSVSQAALTVSLFGAGSFASQLTGGELADRLGRRPVLLMSLFIAPVAMIALGFARSLALIALFTLVLGFFTDLYRPALSAAIADLVPASARTRAFGYQNWAVNLGFSLAPIMAGFMAHYNYLLLFIGDALTTFIFGLIVLARIRETRPPEAVHAAHASLSERIQQVKREPLLLAFSALALFIGVIYMQGYVTLPLDMQAHGLTSADFGLAIAVNGILIVALSIQVSNAASNWPRFRAMAVAALFLGTGFGLNMFARHLLPFYFLTVAVWTMGEITASAVAPALIADLSPIELRGLFQGIFGSAWGLSLFIGPVLGGWVYERSGSTTLWLGCFILGCTLALCYLWMGRITHTFVPSFQGGMKDSEKM